MIEYKLPIGFKYKDTFIKTFTGYEVTGDAEVVFTKKPKPTKVYTWFAEVISVAVKSINNESISDEFLKTKTIPSIIKKIPLLDAGSLLMQIHRESWEDILYDQQFLCVNCGEKINADIDLNRLEVPTKDLETEFLTCKLKKSYTLKTKGVDRFADLEGLTFDTLKFRVPTLADAIKNEGRAKDDVLFWRMIAFDCLVDLSSSKDNHVIPNEYRAGRGSLLFTKDIGARDLKVIRNTLKKELPSVKMYYEDTCPNCGSETPHIANLTNFFSS